MDIAAKLIAVFSFAGAIAGFISGFMPNAWYSLLIAFILIYAIYKVTTLAMKKSVSGFLGEKKKVNMKNFGFFFAKLTTKGETEEKETEVRLWFWPYFIMWLIFWIMTYTLLLLR